MKRVLACLALCALLISPFAFAERKPYALDRSHCQINFVGEALLISAHGHFEKWDADIQLDRENMENSSVAITIEAESLNTRVAQRDKHLRSADFLDVVNHPQIKFVSTKIARVDDKNYTLFGSLTLRGVTKPIGIPVKVVFVRDTDARFKAAFDINRKDYGINYNSRMNPVEDTVALQFDFHIVDQKVMEERNQRRQQQQPPPTTPPF